MNNIVYKNNAVVIHNADCFNISQTLDCGQAFRWKNIGDGIFTGIAMGRFLKIQQINSDIIFHDTDPDTFNEVWLKYFDLDRNYSEIIENISYDPVLKKAAQYGRGIRILRQDPWEALCSFIISQNNNIPRIKGIIDRLCEKFGKKIDGGYNFPTPEEIACLSLEDLMPIRSGFRAKYILDAAKKVSDGTVKLGDIASKPTNEAREELMKIYGVGEKVADCAMLYGMGHLDAFPKDVWIKRALKVFFDGGMPIENEKYAGIIQQYIFFYARENKIEI